MLGRNAAYLAAVKASERIKNELIAAADRLHADATDAAHQTMLASRRDPADADRLHRAHSDAGDARKGMYEDAERGHFDRRAALARHFGQHWTGPGNPEAEHAARWVREQVDPNGDHKVEPAPPPRAQRVEFPAGVFHDHVNGGVAGSGQDYRGMLPDPPRGTFAGDLASAKRAAVMTPAEIAAAEAYRAEQRAPLVSETGAASAIAPATETAATAPAKWVHVRADWDAVKH